MLFKFVDCVRQYVCVKVVLVSHHHQMNFKKTNDFQFLLFFDNQNIQNWIINLAALMNLDAIRLKCNSVKSKMIDDVTLRSKLSQVKSKKNSKRNV